MSNASDAVERIRSTTSRIDAFLAERAETERRRVEDDRRSQSQIDAATNRDIQARFDETLQLYGQRMDQPVVGEDPISYQRHAMVHLRRNLARDDDRKIDAYGTTVGEVASIPIKSLPDSVLANHERMLVAANQIQASAPALSTLPPAGQFMTITKTDPMNGAKEIRHYGKESFIKALSRPGRMVERIVDPVSRQVIWGKPFSRA